MAPASSLSQPSRALSVLSSARRASLLRPAMVSPSLLLTQARNAALLRVEKQAFLWANPVRRKTELSFVQAMDTQKPPSESSEQHSQEYKNQPAEGASPAERMAEQVTAGYRQGMGNAYGEEYSTRSEDEGFGQIYGEPVLGREGIDEADKGQRLQQQGQQDPAQLSKRGNSVVDSAPLGTDK